ncbi:MAG: TonB-dependent receptor [Blastocatellia bacterium]|nr:TonB-dependent receptor [Blastocatellia bacterium]
MTLFLVRAAALLFIAAPIFAQVTTGSISGFVFDPAGRPVPRAEITVTDPSHALVFHATTDGAGYFRLTELPAQTYTAAAAAKDLGSVSTNVRLPVDGSVRVDFHLPVPGLEQSVTVTAEVSPLQTETSELGQVLNQSSIQRLPLNERDFLQLALLTPGVAPPVQGSQLSQRGSFAMHVNGGREEFNNFLLDGVDNNDQENNRYNLQPPVDAVQEFKIAANAYSAEYGRSGAGQVNVITRSGSSEWHGFAYDYLRNKVLDARNFFDGEEKSQYVRNQLGGGGGGPLKKDRTFIFANFDGLRERAGESRLATVPTIAERNGDFSQSGINVIDPFTGEPFLGNQIPGSRQSQLAKQILNLFPLPNLPANLEGVNYLGQPVLNNNYSQFNVRLDQRLSGNDQLSLRYSYGGRDLFEPYAQEATNIPGFGDFDTDRGHNAMAHYVHAFSPGTVNSLLIGFNRAVRRVLPENYQTDVNQLWGIGYLPTRSVDFGYPAIDVAGLSAIGDDTSIPIDRAITTYQLNDTLSIVRGAHYLKLGGEVRNIRQIGILDYLVRGSFSFSGDLSGTGLGDLLLGLPSFAMQSEANNPQNQRTTAYNAFLQDDWKVRPNLTLNLGVRYEYNTPPTDPTDQMSVFNFATHQLSQVGTGGIPRSGIHSNPAGLAPRAGFSWAVTPKTVLRGGYGIYYDAGMLVVNSSLYFNPPYFNIRISYPTEDSLLTLGNPFPAAIIPPASLNTLAPDLSPAYIQNWNLNLQREIGRGSVFSIAYAGSKGTHLIRSRNLNQPVPGPGDLSERRPFPDFDNISLIESGANSNYHALQLSYQHPFSRSFSLIGLYTFAKSIDDTSAFLGDASGANYPQNSANSSAERSLSSFYMKHRATAAAVYALPWRSRWLRNTELRGITIAQSGQPFTPQLRFDNSNTGNIGPPFGLDRPNVVHSPGSVSRSAEEWFDTSAFAIPAPYTFGDAGRNILIGPGMFTIDFSLARKINLSERIYLSFEAQAFNILNHTNFDLPQAYVDEPATFGRILSAKPPRQLQLAVRFNF